MTQIVASVAAHTAYMTRFNTDNSAYSPLATTYNSALAQVATNAALDATTKFFSPPKAVDVPVRPQVPVAPLAYAGNFMQTLAAHKLGTALAAGEVNASTSLGGWGSCTGGLLTGVLNMEHSFGALGADIAGTGMIAQGGSFSATMGSMNTDNSSTQGNCANALNCDSVTANATVAPSYLIVSIIPTAYGAAAWA